MRKPMKIMRYASALAGCLTLAGCATGYGAATGMWNWGYEDRQIEPGVYEISFKATESTKRNDVLAYWQRRAIELCGHDHFWYKNELNIHHYTDSGYAHFMFDLQGVAKCNVPRQSEKADG
jgi:hypothetical protein